jgi:hypothetical protein
MSTENVRKRANELVNQEKRRIVIDLGSDAAMMITILILSIN